MNPSKRPLPPLAESIRIKIKSMIPDLSGEPAENHAELLKTEANGNKTYGGTLLAEQISLMSGQLPIPDPEVCVSSTLVVMEINVRIELGLAFTLLRSSYNSRNRGKERISHSTF
jgi:hypothetical protein